MSNKVPFSTRLEALKMLNEGLSTKEVSKKLKINSTELLVWRELFENEGANAVRLHPRKHADYATKCEIISEYEKNKVPLHILSARYHVSHYEIEEWLRILRHQVRVTAKEAVVKFDWSGNMDSLVENAELRRTIKQQEEKIKYLEAKVALLKKVRTLMEQEPHLRKGGSKPSAH